MQQLVFSEVSDTVITTLRKYNAKFSNKYLNHNELDRYMNYLLTKKAAGMLFTTKNIFVNKKQHVVYTSEHDGCLSDVFC